MKKIFLIVTLSMMVLSMIGCSSSKANNIKATFYVTQSSKTLVSDTIKGKAPSKKENAVVVAQLQNLNLNNDTVIISASISEADAVKSLSYEVVGKFRTTSKSSDIIKENSKKYNMSFAGSTIKNADYIIITAVYSDGSTGYYRMNIK